MDARPDSGWRQATASLLAAALAASLVAGCDSDSADAEQRFAPGLVATANHARSAAAANKLGAPIVRVEFDIGARPAAMRDDLAAIRRSGARPLLLAGFHGRMPTAAEARNVGAWAAAFGPRQRAAGSRWS